MKWSPVSDQGILPDRLLFDRSSLSKFVRFDNSSGMLPEKLLPKSSTTMRTFSCPISTGILPVRLFRLMYIAGGMLES
ncbi:hypothetical protein N665_0076s0230 [Sinapis alba]|nr:hypothetical protein N665_0076s0230 [Sinapis alba]